MRKLAVYVALSSLLLPGGPLGAAEPDIPSLLERLESDALPVRLEAIDSLGLEGADAAVAVPALVELLSDEVPAVRAHAAHALGMIGDAAKPAVEDLVALVGDSDPAVRRAAVDALRKIRPGPEVGIPLFARLLREAGDEVRHRVLDALAEAGEDAVPALIEALGNEETAYWACLVLAEIGPEAKEAVPALTEVLSSDRPEVRREAAIALGEIGPAAAPAVPALIPLLDDELVHVAATFALGMIGPAAKPAEAQIRENSRSEDLFLRNISHWALAKLNPEDPELLRSAVFLLASSLRHEDQQVREAAVRGLADLEPGPELMIPAVRNALEGADPETISNALDAIAMVGEPEVPRLIESLENEEIRAKVVGILRRMGPKAAPAVGPLVELIDDADEDVRREVFFALAEIGPAAKEAVPALIQVLQTGEGPDQYGAAYALGKIGPDAMEAKPALHEALETEDDTLRTLAAWALAHIHPECPETAPKSVPLLIDALGQPDPVARMEATVALRCLGPLAKPAAEALTKVAQTDENELIRQSAAEALEAIAGGPPPESGDRIGRGATVVTREPETALKRGTEVVTVLPEGSRLQVLETRGLWIGVKVEVGGETVKGWVKQSQVDLAPAEQ